MRNPLLPVLLLCACHGTAGGDGAQGKAGTQGARGDVGPEGEQGPPGPAGARGFASKLDIYFVSAEYLALPGEKGGGPAECSDENDVLLNGACGATLYDDMVLESFGPGGTTNIDEGYLADYWCTYRNEGEEAQTVYVTAYCVDVP